MSHGERVRTPARRKRSTIVAVIVVASSAFVGVLGYESSSASSSSATSGIATEPVEHIPHDSFHGDARGAPSEADGVVPDGVTVFDNEYPAVARLEPALLRALRQAATDAARDRVEFYVDSGWRSPKYQEHLLQQAISKYGSEKEAARWVATPDTSAHVAGGAIDIGPANAVAWLSVHGAEYGLCRIYRNEPWHYELRPAAIDHGCPSMYADATHDPRMQQ